MKFDTLSNKVIGCAIEVHRALDPGLLESTYEACLAHELVSGGIPFRQQLEMPVKYKDIYVDCGYRLDLFVDDSLIVELKSVENIHPVHKAQLLTYLKLSGSKTGLLINFNVPILKNGINRLVL